MNQIIKYIKQELGADVGIAPVDNKNVRKLPVYLSSIYNFYAGKINGQSVVFAQYMPESILAPSNYAKQERILRQVWGTPIIFVFNQIQSYNKKRIGTLGINFIIPDSQIHLPELYIILSKSPKKTQIESITSLTPSAQTIILHYLFGDENDFTYKHLQDVLEMPYPTVCRAIETLTKSKMCHVIGSRSKTIHFAEDKATLFNQALLLMKTPVKKVVYADDVPEHAYKAGITALSAFTMVNPDEYEHVAISYDESKRLKDFSTEDKYLPVHIEVWDYDPALFAKDGIVDKISLFLSIKDNQDERLQYEMNQMIQQLW